MPPFGKHPETLVRQEEPFNAGPPPSRLAASPITAVEDFFVRNHGDVPAVDPAAWRLRIEGEVERPLELSLAESPERVLADLTATGATLVSLNPIRDTLEDFFVRRVAEAGDGARPAQPQHARH